MEALHLILTLFVIGMSIFSLISYSSRRADSRASREQLLAKDKHHRLLTQEEQQLIAELDKADWQSTHQQVFYLKGEYLGHGLEGGEMHRTIGGVEVVLPFDALNHVTEDNLAEVVNTDGKKMLVVSLNDSFTLAGGKADQAAREVSNERWQQGAVGVLNDDSELPEEWQVKVLSSRQESLEERQLRYSPSWKIVTALLLAASLACLAWSNDDPLFWGIPALVFLALALWAYSRKRALPEPLKVNYVEGVLRKVNGFYLVGNMEAYVPPEWHESKLLTGQIERFEMRTDHQLMQVPRLGLTHKPKKPAAWVHHLVLGLTALVMLGLGLINFSSPKADLFYSWHWLMGTEATNYHSLAELKAKPPAVGDWVYLRGKARCWGRYGYSGSPCETLLFGAPEDLGPLPEASAAWRELLESQWFEKASLSSSEQLYLTMLAVQSGRHFDPSSLRTLTDPNKLVLLVERACASGCDYATQTLTELMDEDWSTLLEKARKGELEPVLLNSSRAAQVSRSLDNEADTEMRQLANQSWHQLEGKASLGQLLEVWPSPLYWPTETAASDYQSYLALKKMAGPEGQESIAVPAVVIANGERLVLDSGYYMDRPWPFLSGGLYLALSALLALCQLLLAWRGARRQG
ncbi:IgaA/UmoB family intracellular growth attenuator [Gallaecimonas xiamenensis]|uniref:Intracellular growth attenuator IgaA n=1 Tax=Gallaecimonas xiamenensis 3-C-1 TaxID=745411 RepID=K2JLB5_9GAMM|nr:IgaA/UmoB family intracellular growth attenuator [Gallaecimonas xiamenensis]EKE75172.1 hypothetical protein B3C1_07846 [Gallaecimonas xiamenensis 3-C-1]